MSAGQKRKRSYSRDDVDHEPNQSPRQSRLQLRITETIERHKVQYQTPGSSTSESLMRGFIEHIWPDIRDDYRQMTQNLEGELKQALKERHIDAEVSSRVKDDDSITKTLERRQKGLLQHRGIGFNSYQDIFHEMHDLCGLRVVLMDREHRSRAHGLIDELFRNHKSPVHFDPNREVGQFWKKPWFGAYETHNHRLQLANDNKATRGASYQYSGVMFEIQITTFSDNLYNKLAHTLLYKADAGLITWQEEMVIDVSHGLARCFELCMRIVRPKLHREIDNRIVRTAEDVGKPTKEFEMAQSVVDRFEKDLNNQQESDRIAQLLRKLLSKKEDAEDQACLKDLLVSDPRDDKTRIQETKGGLLRPSFQWILKDHDFQRWREDDQKQPFWIIGSPGKGKTMMLCGIIDELRKMSGTTNVSYFFCQGTDERINTGTAVLRGLLFLLCNQQHSLISHIRHKYDKAGRKLFEDTNSWFALSAIFDSILGDSGLRGTYLVVDALDECLPDSRQLLVDLIVRMSNAYPAVKWIVSSRELEEFKSQFREATQLSLESREESISEAVSAYIDSKVTRMEQSFSISAMKRIADELRKKSGSTFLWVAIVCKELESAEEYEVMDILQEMPTGLHELFGKLVQGIKALRRRNPTYCQSVLRTVAVAFRPLTLKELQELADLPDHVPADTVVAKMCRSFLTIRDNTVFFVHQSAKDYLSSEWSFIFQPSIRDTHESMFSRSVEAMTRILKQDIYNLRHPGKLIEDVQKPRPDPLVSIRYSCVYWTTHFREAQTCYAEHEVDKFLRTHFLHWYEALSLIRSAPSGVNALRDLVTCCNKGALFEPLLHLASDMYRFAHSYGAIIGQAPLQAYSSALIFSPARCLTRMLFTSKEPDWIVQKPKVEQHWDTLVTLVSGHPARVVSAASTLDGRRIASGSQDGTVRIWDTETGDIIRTIEYTSAICSVSFSPDGGYIAARTSNDTFVISAAGSRNAISSCSAPCDVSADVLLGYPVALSLGGRFIATTLKEAIIIQDSQDGRTILKLSGHTCSVRAIAFSPKDSHVMASASDDYTIKIWNVESGAQTSNLNVGAMIYLLRFDPCGTFLRTDSMIPFRGPMPFQGQKSLSSKSTPSHTELGLPHIRQDGYSVNADGSWITWHGRNILWLPPEFRRSECDPPRLQDGREIPGSPPDKLLQDFSSDVSPEELRQLSYTLRHQVAQPMNKPPDERLEDCYRPPPESPRIECDPRRPWDVLPRMISIGCSSGRVWWVKFSSEHHPFALE